MKIHIIDCGLGNINSITKCIESLNYDFKIAKNPVDINESSKIIFPGVGSFSKAMELILLSGWHSILKNKILNQKVFFLGICLGMQILSNYSLEFKKTEGLSIIDTYVEKIDQLGCDLSIPHIGWNDILIKKKDKLFQNIKNNSNFYFDHSYSLNCLNSKSVIATTHHGIEIVAAVNYNNIYGVQFHPEKSSDNGKQLIKNFLEMS